MRHMCKAIFPYVFLSTFTLLFLFLLWKTYPFSLPFPDSGSYIGQAKSLKLLTPNPYDWARPPAYSILLQISWLFSQPTIFIFWAQAIGFLLCMNIAFWSMKPLFTSTGKTIVFCIVLFSIEIMLMRVLISTTWVLADALYTCTVFIGSLLMLGSWNRTWRSGLFVGALVMGLAPLLKPIGLVLLPLWFVFLLILYRGKSYSIPTVLLCVMLLLGPSLFWSARNSYIYGRFTPTAYGGFHLLANVLPLLEDEDTILPNPNNNQKFIAHVRLYEEKVGLYNYFGYGVKDINAPYVALTKIESVTSPLKTPYAMHFINDVIITRAALHIIYEHPIAYMAQTWKTYMGFMMPLNTGIPDFIGDATPVYVRRGENMSDADMRALFPPNGMMNIDAGNTLIGAFLERLHLPKKLYSPLQQLERIFFWIWHLLPLLLIASLLVPKLLHLRRQATYLLMLFVTGAVQCLGNAATVPVISRLSISSEMLLRTASLLLITMLLSGLYSFIRIAPILGVRLWKYIPFRKEVR